MGTAGKQSVEPEQVAGEHQGRVGEVPVAGGVRGVPLIALGHEIHHQKPPLGDGEVEAGGLADDGGVNVAHGFDHGPHGRVLGLLTEA
jgi:hypothetical protein